MPNRRVRKKRGRVFARLLRERAEDALGSETAASRWLRTPLVALSGRTPVEMLGTRNGLRVVWRLLGRLEHGVHS